MEELFSFYGLTTVILGLVWAVIFSLHEELRLEQLILGMLATLLLPIFFVCRLLDATTISMDFSALSAIDLGFAFFLAGIAGTIFHAIFGRHYHHLSTYERMPFDHRHKKITQLWITRFFLMFLLFLWSMIFLTVGLELTTPYALLVSVAVFVIYFITHRHDLLSDALWSCFLTTFVVLLAGIIAAATVGTEFGVSPIRSHDTVLGVPFDLLLWGTACGIGLGPIYEFIRNIKIK